MDSVGENHAKIAGVALPYCFRCPGSIPGKAPHRCERLGAQSRDRRELPARKDHRDRHSPRI